MRSLVLFDGLGARNESLIPALRQARRHSGNAAFFHSVHRALDEMVDYLGPVVLPDGLPLEKWLGGVEPRALDSTATGVLVHVHQLVRLQPGTPPGDVVGALGHSIGLQAAVVAGVRSRRLDDFFALATGSVKLVLAGLVRAQQLAPDTGAPMCAVTGPTTADLRAVLTDHPTVSIGLINTPTAHVLTGPPADLRALRGTAPFTRQDTTWTDLPTTIPFHSPLLAGLPARVRADLPAIGPLPGPGDLALPVYAADGGRDLRGADDLVTEYLDQVFARPNDWASAVTRAVADASADRVLDAGPGPGARRFTRECLRGTTVRVEPLRPAG
ncbi:ACP S-malonyltransferase [Actinokineospora auranticolor]|uniref:Malonyl CoA-acyl carrier protein transacylase n=1 Tax=Actinokineospora auranticolor TaxID=155976 RepID=A0A2S6GD87_9PSEU|nr:ACP S-malonyltransferase [Actinokineospora auranticolor]PPK63193.1 malonyl CoA-acyl carrier protein transacylase [Actinokineospora auranticolor]